MEVDLTALAIQAANVRLTCQLLLTLSEAKLLHPERAIACAVDIRLIARLIEENSFAAHGHDAPPQTQAATFQGIAQLLENQAEDSSSYRARP